jgi:hypothetical protein
MYDKKICSILFVGLVRGFKYEHTRNNIYKFLLDPLKEQFNLKIFIHTYDKEFDESIHKLNYEKIIIDSNEEIENKYIKIINNYKWQKSIKHDFWKTGWFKYWNSIYLCNNLRLENEKLNNYTSEWIIVTSPQMKPMIKIPNLTKLKNNLYTIEKYRFGGYYDSFFFGKNNEINYISNLINWVKTQYNTEIHPETIFKKYIDLKLKMHFIDMLFNRIRFNNLIIDH